MVYCLVFGCDEREVREFEVRLGCDDGGWVW